MIKPETRYKHKVTLVVSFHLTYSEIHNHSKAHKRKHINREEKRKKVDLYMLNDPWSDGLTSLRPCFLSLLAHLLQSNHQHVVFESLHIRDQTHMVAAEEQAQTQEPGWRREGEGRGEEQEDPSIPREEESIGAVMQYISIRSTSR
jgi:hypothetical protein